MISRKYPHLFTPLKVGPLTFKNRIEAAPISVGVLSPDGYLTRENIAFFRLKAKGGAAVVTIGAGVVHTPPTSRTRDRSHLMTKECCPRWWRRRMPSTNMGPSLPWSSSTAASRAWK